MSQAVGAQAVDLINSMPFYGYDTSIIERENLGLGDGYGQLNIPWYIGLSAMMGNAGTTALSRNAVVFCEPEWGYECVGMGSSYPGGVIGGPSGGLTVAW